MQIKTTLQILIQHLIWPYLLLLLYPWLKILAESAKICIAQSSERSHEILIVKKIIWCPTSDTADRGHGPRCKPFHLWSRGRGPGDHSDWGNGLEDRFASKRVNAPLSA